MGVPLQKNCVRLFGGINVVTKETSVVTDYITVYFPKSDSLTEQIFYCMTDCHEVCYPSLCFSVREGDVRLDISISVCCLQG